MITGLGPSTVPLLNKYVARTGDIQTASLLLSYFAEASSQSDIEQALGGAGVVNWRCWMDEYRDLLDR